MDKLNWNNSFQNYIKLLKTDPRKALGKIHLLYSNFLMTAQLYTKIIVEEYVLPIEDKTIRPISIGGIAGGDKYLIEGIFFKFALDKANLYGGHSNASKAAGHELRSLNLLLNQFPEDINFPLCVCIDYLGYRVLCTNVLPISHSTLIYGSSDGGKTVQLSDSLFRERLTSVCRNLGLKSHIVETIHKIPINTPFDLEVFLIFYFYFFYLIIAF